MKSYYKWMGRDRKLRKRKYGMRVDGSSVKELEKLIQKRNKEKAQGIK